MHERTVLSRLPSKSYALDLEYKALTSSYSSGRTEFGRNAARQLTNHDPNEVSVYPQPWKHKRCPKDVEEIFCRFQGFSRKNNYLAQYISFNMTTMRAIGKSTRGEDLPDETPT
jgi:hypothetical protein